METSTVVPTIFVSIASYRDSECQYTIKDLFEKARNPDRIFVGVCWQFDPEEDVDCFLIETRPEQVRIKKMHWKEARGPCLARYWTQSLWNGEDYYLQTDSHMRFVKNWDEKLIESLTKCPSSKPILTTYPLGYELPNKVPLHDKKPCVLVAQNFGQEGMLRLSGKQLNKCLDKPIKSLFWVSGFSFSKSEMIKEVPYDPHLPFLFFGEEALMNLRLWTHGWDFYAPGENICFHLWSREHRKTFREIDIENKKEIEDNSLKRVNRFLGVNESIDNEIESDKYGLGNDRNASDYASFSGVHFIEKKIDERAKNGGIDPSLFVDYLLNMIMRLANQK